MGDHVPPITRSVTARRGEAGFTLVELVVAVVILGILIGPLAGSLIIGFKANGATVDRLAESHDAQMAAAMFARDVEGAAKVTVGQAACSSAGQPGSVDLVDMNQAGGGWVSYSYARISNSPVNSGFGPTGDETVIVRTTCDSSGTVSGTLTVVHLADSAPGHTPFAGCNGAATATSCTSVAQPPSSVELHYWDASGNPYVLAGDSRATVASGTQPDALAGEMPALVLLGPDVYNPDDKSYSTLHVGAPGANGDTTLTANRDILVDGAMKLVGDAVVDTTGSTLGVLGGCSGLPQGCTTLATAEPDPLGGKLSPPDGTGCDIDHGTAPCPVTSSTLTVNGGTLNPGIYTGKVTVNKPGVTLNPGTYIFEGGLEVTKKAVVQGVRPGSVPDAGVLLYVGCPAGASGCGTSSSQQIYVHQGGSLAVAPMMSGPYSSIVVYQDPKDTNPLLLSGGDLGTVLPGVIYAPGAQVVVKNGAQNMFGGLIAQTATFTGGSTTLGFTP